MPLPKKVSTQITLQFESKQEAEGFIYWWTVNGGQEKSNFRTVLPETYKKDAWMTSLLKSKLLILKRVTQ